MICFNQFLFFKTTVDRLTYTAKLIADLLGSCFGFLQLLIPREPLLNCTKIVCSSLLQFFRMLSISLLLILTKLFFDVSCGCFAILDVCSALTRVTTVFPKIYFFKLCFIASITKNMFPEVFDVILLWGFFWKKRSFACVLVLHHH